VISARYARTLLVLLAMALVPTIIHSYAGVTVTDGRSTAAIPERLAGHRATPGTRNSGWGQRHFDSNDWFSRRYISDAGQVTLTAVHGYDLKALYHHPELAVAYDTPFADYAVRYLPGHPSVPVHVLTDGNGAIGLYVLVYGDTYVADPMSFQVRTAAALLFSGRRPMTLLFAQQTMARRGVDAGNSDAATVLFAALDAFTRQ
jgi:hypothetical protein